MQKPLGIREKAINTHTPTIFALSSGKGRAGVAVIRVSGPCAAEAIKALTGRLAEPRYATLRCLQDPVTGETLDHALVLWLPGPKSFTGEDVAEFHVHGGPAVIEAVLNVLGHLNNFEPAEPGAFTRRAFENGKLDLTAVEGLADLIDAETEAQRRQALRQSEGHLGVLYESWRARLIHVLAMTESALDFSDEGDVPSNIAKTATPDVESLLNEVLNHLQDGHRGELLRDGFRVVIAGPPNVGKSSLLNALARRDAAIVSEEAGTTRDVIEVRLDLNGYPVIVTDTAGLREAKGGVEQEGIRRTLHHASEADLILWMTAIDIEEKPPPHDLLPDFQIRENRVLKVLNKIDLLSGAEKRKNCDLEISAKIGVGIDALTSKLTSEAEVRMDLGDVPAVTRVRHRQELENCRAALQAYLEGESQDTELRAEDLRQASQALGRLTGRVDVEDVLDHIFSSFCIGK